MGFGYVWSKGQTWKTLKSDPNPGVKADKAYASNEASTQQPIEPPFFHLIKPETLTYIY